MTTKLVLAALVLAAAFRVVVLDVAQIAAPAPAVGTAEVTE
jgi:hypothetical protein